MLPVNCPERPTFLASAGLTRWSAILGVGLLVVTVWSYWPVLADMSSRWQSDPQYSHGFLVPLFSLYLLWTRRAYLASSSAAGRWYGVGLIGAGLALRAAGAVLFVGWFESLSMLLCLAGCALGMAGWSGLRWAYPGILFLIFMIPLPYTLQTAMSSSLQSGATHASTYLLIALGVPAVSEGNVILLSNDTSLGVVAACSGLGMLVTFLALATGVALLLKGEPGWAKAVVVLSAGPIAVAVNVLRITVTGLLYDRSQAEWARWVFHDVAGWLMMPVGLVLLVGLVWAARRLVVPVTLTRPPVLLAAQGFSPCATRGSGTRS